MQCEKCNYETMTKKMLQGGLAWDYSTIYEFSCPECDYSFKKVA
jgi:hypothetical protein